MYLKKCQVFCIFNSHNWDKYDEHLTLCNIRTKDLQYLGKKLQNQKTGKQIKQKRHCVAPNKNLLKNKTLKSCNILLKPERFCKLKFTLSKVNLFMKIEIWFYKNVHSPGTDVLSI